MPRCPAAWDALSARAEVCAALLAQIGRPDLGPLWRVLWACEPRCAYTLAPPLCLRGWRQVTGEEEEES